MVWALVVVSGGVGPREACQTSGRTVCVPQEFISLRAGQERALRCHALAASMGEDGQDKARCSTDIQLLQSLPIQGEQRARASLHAGSGHNMFLLERKGNLDADSAPSEEFTVLGVTNNGELHLHTAPAPQPSFAKASVSWLP